MLKIHALLSAIKRVVSSQKSVNLVVYNQKCKKVSQLIVQYKWVQINHTLQWLIHHSGELIARNDGYALGSLSEEGLEATNKFIHNYCPEPFPFEQLTDVLSSLLERSNQEVVSKT